MQNENTDSRVSFGALVHKLLGLDPSAMAALSPTEAVNDPVVPGLHLFMAERSSALTLVDRPNPIVSPHSAA